MQFLQVKDIHKAFTDKPLLDGVSFSILKGQKVALVAKNGAGKSTLLRILMDEIEPNQWTVNFNKDIKVRFLSQTFDVPDDMSVWDALYVHDNPLGQLLRKYELLLADPQADQIILHQTLQDIEKSHAWEYEVKLKSIVSQLQLTGYVEQSMGSLSGGEAKRVALAKALLDEPHFLILDEPTNHLDLEMIERLENYLKKSSMTLLLVTHDRYFLERVCTDIYELDRGKLYMYPGNYEKFLYKKAEREEQEAKEVHHLKMLYKNELYRIRKAPRARWAKSVGRTKKFYALEDNYRSQKGVLQEQFDKLELEMDQRRLGSKVLKIHSLSKSYGDKQIIKKFTYDFRQGERVGIIGKNGVGKSTFVNMIAWLEQPDHGTLDFWPTVKVGYYQQKQAIADSDVRVIDYVKEVAEYITIGKIKLSASQLLERFLFSTKQQQAKLFSLSGGERRRLHLLVTLIANPNFLILDEPTNDLDLMTLAVLEEFLLAYQGCLIIISHDRFFMDKLVDHLFVFQGEGEIFDFRWSYSEYKLNPKSSFSKPEIFDDEEKVIPENLETKPMPKKLSYNEKREFEQLGSDIQKLDQRKEEINLMFQEEGLEADKIVHLWKELSVLMTNLESKEARWLELAERE